MPAVEMQRSAARILSVHVGSVERDWQEDFNHENGQYQNVCCHCKLSFIGYKRRPSCKECAAKHVTNMRTRAGKLNEITAMVTCFHKVFHFNTIEQFRELALMQNFRIACGNHHLLYPEQEPITDEQFDQALQQAYDDVMKTQ